LWRLLDEVEKRPSLVPGLSISEVKRLREQLKAHSDILGRIRTHRDKRMAHVDERHSWPDSSLCHHNLELMTTGQISAY